MGKKGKAKAVSVFLLHTAVNVKRILERTLSPIKAMTSCEAAKSRKVLQYANEPGEDDERLQVTFTLQSVVYGKTTTQQES